MKKDPFLILFDKIQDINSISEKTKNDILEMNKKLDELDLIVKILLDKGNNQ